MFRMVLSARARIARREQGVGVRPRRGHRKEIESELLDVFKEKDRKRSGVMDYKSFVECMKVLEIQLVGESLQCLAKLFSKEIRDDGRRLTRVDYAVMIDHAVQAVEDFDLRTDVKSTSIIHESSSETKAETKMETTDAVVRTAQHESWTTVGGLLEARRKEVLDAKDQHGRTALHIACANARLEVSECRSR